MDDAADIALRRLTMAGPIKSAAVNPVERVDVLNTDEGVVAHFLSKGGHWAVSGDKPELSAQRP